MEKSGLEIVSLCLEYGRRFDERIEAAAYGWIRYLHSGLATIVKAGWPREQEYVFIHPPSHRLFSHALITYLSLV